jgi:hypothetical protein
MIKQQQQFNNNAFQYILTISSSHVFIPFFFEWEQVHIFPHVPMFQGSFVKLVGVEEKRRAELEAKVFNSQLALQDQRGRSRGFEVSILWCLSGAKNNLGRHNWERCFWDGRVSIDL